QIFTISEGSEFANGNAKVINFNLKMANVITGSQTFSIVNYPNPFTNTTTITYTLPEAGQVRLVLTDMFGKTITVLEDAYKTSGTYSIQVNPASFSLSQGVYLYKIDVNGASDTYSKINKMIFQK
ncbi:MAG TPA: T9SS type A sorting domain-containing protein, partial [Bacteroidales bacterium]|nr:T9SS type A sorting domain-containing protein [Bacteroidales bacterium]